ncbi:MAG: indolepyruvate ferredoxin oxidoreductase subunit alpha [Kiritimatiellae bacterium]|nr:indolepyruvate ferredoxin oxidoreductase subunit alpha [Kiritimatiellia bacterium]
MKKRLLTGNEAIARGAFEGGVTAAFGYPGTPSTEILENLAKYKDEGVWAEWSPNEKVALEAAAGASIAGARTLVTMKLVGLNVAADPLMTLSYVGVAGGMVIVVADDPGQDSSQTEQDTRHYARLAKVPCLEPADAAEARDFVVRGFELSEKYNCPVILRTTTCVAHSRALVEERPPRPRNETRFVRDVPRFVPLPLYGRVMRRKVEDRIDAQAADAASSSFNTVIRRGSALGIVSHGVAALHTAEVFPDASILKIGWGWPFPDALFRDFASSVDRVLVVDEGDPILEERLRSLGIACDGKNYVPRCGEITPSRLHEVRRAMFPELGLAPLPAPVPEAADIPARPPMLCPGCPHRGLFLALGNFDVIVTGDIGCYSLGAFPPLSRTDTILCMGAGFTMAHGMRKAGEKKPVVGIVGDSTFFHSGITGLLDVVYNKSDVTLVVVDNRITAMTGHQDHPGTGTTLLGETTKAASIEGIARACGVERIRVVNPYDQKETVAALREEIAAPEPSLVISRAPCPLHVRKPVGPLRRTDPAKCVGCKACLKCGCPALEIQPDGKPRVNASVCNGCGICDQLCRFGALAAAPDAK